MYFFGASSTNAYYWGGIIGTVGGEGGGHLFNGDSNLLYSACDSITGQYGSGVLNSPSLIFVDEDAAGGVASNPWQYYFNTVGSVTTSSNAKLKH
jgi:hypothetical protein